MESKIIRFLNYFDELVDKVQEPIPNDVQEFYNWLKTQGEDYIEKPLFTENGLQILEYLQSCDIKSIKAKDIAEGMSESSRKISGAIRKLVSDGYVDKFGQNPVVYSLTLKGKEFDTEKYKETLNKTNKE